MGKKVSNSVNKDVTDFDDPYKFLKYEYNRIKTKKSSIDTLDLDLDLYFKLNKNRYRDEPNVLFESDKILFKKLKEIASDMKVPFEEQHRDTFWLLNRHSNNILKVAKENNIIVPDNIILATLPFDELDAFTCDFPLGQKLVALNEGLFFFLYQMGRVVSSFFTRKDDETKTDSMTFNFNEEEVFNNIKTNRDGHLRFLETLIQYFVYQDLSLSDIFFQKDHNMNLSAVFWDTAELFIVAHEYSHIILDHLGEKNNFSKEYLDEESKLHRIMRNWSDEVSADKLSFQLTMAQNKNQGYGFFGCYIGIEFLFACFSIIERILNIEFSETHPTSNSRILYLRDYFKRLLPQNAKNILNDSQLIPQIINMLWDINKDDFYYNMDSILKSPAWRSKK